MDPLKMKEVGALPRGPVEESAVWFAGARMGYNVLSFRVWGCGVSGYRWITYCSRVIEKGTVYSMALLKDVLTKIDLTNTREIKFWSDCGRHFMSNRSIATQSVKILQLYATESNKLRQVSTAFGLGNHFKNECDGYFGLFNKSAEEFSQKKKYKSSYISIS